MKNKLSFLFGLVLIFYGNVNYSQCTLAVNSSSVNVTCGDSINIIATGQSYAGIVNEDFNTSSLPLGWALVGAPDFSNPCSPSLDGSPSVWMGSAVAIPRVITTQAYDVQCGGQICFDLDFGGDDNTSGNCEDPDLTTEGISFEYSTNGGATWNLIFYHPAIGGYANQYYQWGTYCYQIPAAGLSANTSFRWSQVAVSSNVNDHWGIDNFNLQATSCSGAIPYYFLLDGASFDGDTTVFSAINHVYTIEYTNGIDDTCSALVNAVVTPFDASFILSPDTVCTSESINWTPTVLGNSGGYFSASPSGVLLDSVTGNIDYQNSTGGQYNISYQSTNPSCGSSSGQLVQIIDAPILFAGNDTTVEANVPFSLNAYNPSNVAISWSGGVIDGSPFSLVMGNYQYVVSLVSPVTGCPSTDTIQVTAVNPPTISAIIVDDNGTSSGSIDATIVTFGGPVFSTLWSNGATTEDIVNLPASHYTITVTDSSGIQGSNTFTVVSTVGINESENFGINIFPNPGSDLVLINSSSDFDVELFDVAGNLVYSGQGKQQYELQVKTWASGAYILHAKNEKSVITKKFVVK